jgi:hypothetical protein
MRNFLRPFVALLVAAPFLASVARAAFDDEFSLVSPASPAGYYTLASDVAALGQWSAAFFPATTGQSHIDTGAAPASVTIGASAASPESVSEESTAVLFIDLPADGHVSFSIQSINTGSGDFYAGAEIYLSGVAHYFLTDPNAVYVLEFDAFSGETLEFRSVALSTGAAASNQAVISNFTFTPASAIPEPSAYAVFLGLGALGFTARRRRAP